MKKKSGRSINIFQKKEILAAALIEVRELIT
jgi:hypothetical protein